METNKYRTSGVIDEATYREISKLAVSRRRVWFARIFSVIMGLFTILMIIVRDYPYMVMFLVFTILFALLPMLITKRSIRTVLKRMAEAYPEGCVRIETFFSEEGIELHNLSNGGKGTLPYGTIQRVAETEHYFYLNTKANQFTLVFKELLTPEQMRSFLPFLREKCPDIKVVR